MSYSARSIYLILLTQWSRDKDKANKEFMFPYRDIQEVTKDLNGKKLSSQTISNALAELDKAGFISISYGGRNNPSKYKVNLDWLT